MLHNEMSLRTIQGMLEEYFSTLNAGNPSLLTTREMRLIADPTVSMLISRLDISDFDIASIKSQSDLEERITESVVRRTEIEVRMREFHIRHLAEMRYIDIKSMLTQNIDNTSPEFSLENVLTDAFYSSLTDHNGIGDIHATIHGKDLLSVCTKYNKEASTLMFFLEHEGFVYAFETTNNIPDAKVSLIGKSNGKITEVVEKAKTRAYEKCDKLTKDNQSEKTRLLEDMTKAALQSADRLIKSEGGFFYLCCNDFEEDIVFAQSTEKGCIMREFKPVKAGVIMIQGYGGNFNENQETEVYFVNSEYAELKEMARRVVNHVYETLYIENYQNKNKSNSKGPVYVCKNDGFLGVTADGKVEFSASSIPETFECMKNLLLTGRTFVIARNETDSIRGYNNLSAADIDSLQIEYMQNLPA